jgi:hypothetical protein
MGESTIREKPIIESTIREKHIVESTRMDKNSLYLRSVRTDDVPRCSGVVRFGAAPNEPPPTLTSAAICNRID